MSIMSFMEAMGTNTIPFVASFFIGLMTAISPCPLATNITAIAYISKKIDNSKHTLLVSLLYTLGRMFTYVIIASSIVWFGLNIRFVSLFLQKYGEMFLGPLLILIGLVMLDLIKLKFLKSSPKLNTLQEKLVKKGYLGSFLLGVIFALAFCPLSAVLFFGMLIPLAIRVGDGFLIPSIFAIATGLPVIIFSFVLVYGISKLSWVMNKVQTLEKWIRKIVAIIFILVGIYYVIIYLF
ncbi:MAG: sulfite exporter TauE/SafE family protein [Nanoarchaeota archaeon]|nr:sulfite exporter TauE/SafE family protein [Nanoarchaeota archaeon]MBU1004786.1 sulfite exporter TauE/SafE family protein [Nanoarchaeota archaeon]MBU1945544.1 sulfite exporter TauE/SafE family protein [Nanoarchaeota archaeon]